MDKLIILFGLAGSGKNFVGQGLAGHLGYYFWDGDAVLTKAMREAIEQKRLFTQAMRDEFIDLFIQNMVLLQQKHPQLVVAQGLYKEKNRLKIAEAFPNAQWVLVQCSLSKMRERLQGRGGVSVDYALMAQKEFEAPQLPHHIILNEDGLENVLLQYEQMFS